MLFATCSYRQFHPALGIPVQTSIGTPKFPLGYRPHELPEVMPRRDMLRLPYEPFRRAYRHKLHRQTLPRILAACERIHQAAGTDPNSTTLVLLCFENLGDPDAWCHRSLLAEWLDSKTGREVPELGDLLLALPAGARVGAVHDGAARVTGTTASCIPPSAQMPVTML